METTDLITKACKIAEDKFMGSATVVALRLMDDMTIKAGNLGDSGYALFHVRPDDTLEMYYRSTT